MAYALLLLLPVIKNLLKDAVKARTIGGLPIIVSNDIESLVKTKDLKKALVGLGIGEDLQEGRKV